MSTKPGQLQTEQTESAGQTQIRELEEKLSKGALLPHEREQVGWELTKLKLERAHRLGLA